MWVLCIQKLVTSTQNVSLVHPKLVTSTQNVRLLSCIQVSHGTSTQMCLVLCKQKSVTKNARMSVRANKRDKAQVAISTKLSHTVIRCAPMWVTHHRANQLLVTYWRATQGYALKRAMMPPTSPQPPTSSIFGELTTELSTSIRIYYCCSCSWLFLSPDHPHT